jgi:hypothetical protein
MVRLSNYEPPEVDSLWLTLDLAEKRCRVLGGMWEVAEWEACGPDAPPSFVEDFGGEFPVYRNDGKKSGTRMVYRMIAITAEGIRVWIAQEFSALPREAERFGERVWE